MGHGVRRAEPPLRLTRRGRAVVLSVLILLASLASAVLFTTASRADQPPAGSPTVEVRSGDTLWDIAARVDPGANGQDVVADLRRLNDLPDSVVRPGDVLILPRAH